MLIVLAVFAALGYGLSDFAGGLAARRLRPLTALTFGYPAGLLVLIAWLPWCPGSLTLPSGLLAGAAGLCGVLGLAVLYRLMAHAAFHVVAPITAVMAAAVPLLFGIVIAHEHLSLAAGLGLAVGVGAVVMTNSNGPARSGPPRPMILLLATLCGSCFGAYFVLIAQSGQHGGMPALLVARGTASLALVAARRVSAPSPSGDRPIRPPLAGHRALAVTAGLTDAAADVCFLLAARHGYVSIAGTIAAQYPVITVLLALTVLRERTGWRPATGVGLTAVSLALLAR